MREPTEHTEREMHDLEYYREEERRERVPDSTDPNQENWLDFVDDDEDERQFQQDQDEARWLRENGY